VRTDQVGSPVPRRHRAGNAAVAEPAALGCLFR
jgi:hypothetical protein